MDDPHAKGFDPGLLSSNTFMTAKHAQGELVDPGLQHGAKLPLEEVGPRLWGLITTFFALPINLHQAIRVSRVVVIVSLDQREKCPGHITPLLCLWGGGARGACLLGTTSPSREAKIAPAAVPGGLRFVSRALAAFLVVYTPGGAAHFYTLHFRLSKYCLCDLACWSLIGKFTF